MKKNRRKGFTIIEIIIALAILSIVMIAASRFMMSVLIQYTRDNDDIKLQTEVEEILNLVENKLMGAVSAQVTDAGELEVSLSGDSTASTLVFFADDGDFYYAQDGNKDNAVYLGTHVSNVTYEITSTTVIVKLQMKINDLVYNASRTILLRNAVAEDDDLAELFRKIRKLIEASESAQGDGDKLELKLPNQNYPSFIELEPNSESNNVIHLHEELKEVFGSGISKIMFAVNGKKVTVTVTTDEGKTETRIFECKSGITGDGNGGSDNPQPGNNPGGNNQGGNEEPGGTGNSGGTEEPGGTGNSGGTEEPGGSGNSGGTGSSGESGGEQDTQPPQPQTPVEEGNLKDNDVIVTSSTVKLENDHYVVKFTLKNQGKPVKWADLNLRYYYNCPERYNFGTANVKIVTDNPIPENVKCDLLSAITERCENSVGYIPVKFGTYWYETFDTNKTITVTFEVGNKINGTWGPLYISENNNPHSLESSYSYQNTNNIPLYIGNTKIYGVLPKAETELSNIDVQVANNNSKFSNDKKDCTVSFEISNRGKALDWDKLEIRYFYMKPPRETLQLKELSGTSKEIPTVTTGFTTPKSFENTFSDASDYFSISLSSAGKYYTDEKINISFALRYASGRSLDDGDRKFTESHSLKAPNYIGVYYDGTLLDGYTAPSGAYETGEFKPQIVASNDTFYIDNGNNYTVEFTLQNLGGDVDWEDVELRYYFMQPSDREVKLPNHTCSVNGDVEETIWAEIKPIKPALQGATNYVSLRVQNRNDRMYTSDSLQVLLTMKYADKSLMTDEKTNYGFQNSYSLMGVDNIAVYYKDRLVWGKVPKTEAEAEYREEDTEKKSLVVEECTSSENWPGLKVHVKLKNIGDEYINLRYVQIRYFYYLSNAQLQNVIIYFPATASIVPLEKRCANATGYISVDLQAKQYLSKDGTYEMDIYAGRNDAANLNQYGILNSYSWGNGVAVYYKGELVFGSEPAGIKYDSDITAFPNYPQKEMPEDLNVDWYYVGGEDNNMGAKYSYNFRTYCSNWQGLDWSKFVIYIHQHYDTKGMVIPKLIPETMPSGDYITEFMKSSKGEDQQCMKLYGFDGAEYVSFQFSTVAKGTSGADINKAYTKNKETLEIYYDGELVWPKAK